MRSWSSKTGFRCRVSGSVRRAKLGTRSRKGAENKKFEAQNPKFETNPNAQKLENSKAGASDWCFEFSPVLGLFGFEFVSNFDIRISDFIELI
jgi:hypothetical protein